MLVTTIPTPTSDSDNYCDSVLPPGILEKLQAGAFRQLCQHLQERSDEVQNMDLMTLSGFCRNCLAKWMVVEARSLVDQQEQPDNDALLSDLTVQALNALGYEQAAQHVYGMTYGDWKKRHQKKATDEQLQKLKDSSPLHAKHDKALLATRGDAPGVASGTTTTTTTAATTTTEDDKKAPSTSLLSNVCCQTVDDDSDKKESTITTTAPTPAKKTRTLPPYTPAPLPTYTKTQQLNVGIMTVSDRASRGEYATGDLSGPAVEQALRDVLMASSSSELQLNVTGLAIVPDDKTAIVQQLQAWKTDAATNMDFIFTTGGTGMSPRDVTPEATQQVLTTECQGIMAFCLSECSKIQPLASLSRGTAGIMTTNDDDKNSSRTIMVANLPGNPKAVHEIMPLLLPLMLHAQQHF